MQKIFALLPGIVLSLGIAVTAGSRAQGESQGWAGEMFKQTDFNFGTVARGAKAEHRFSLQNIWKEDVHITAVEPGCTCTSATATKTTLKSLETADIVATINTGNNIGHGHKEATIKVKFDQPFAAEVRLKVSCFLREDVVVQPGVVQFDSVPLGDGAARVVQVSYAGRPDWKIAEIEVANPNLDVVALQTNRAAGKVSYDLTVKLKRDAPVGYFKDQIILVTDDPIPQTARVPVPIEGSVVASITLTPSPLWFGVLAPGEKMTKNLLVRSRTPFRVLGVKCDDPRFTFTAPDGAKRLQTIEVNFHAGPAAGDVTQKITVETDAPGGKALEATVQARVTKPEPPAATEKTAPLELKPLPPSSLKTTST